MSKLKHVRQAVEHLADNWAKPSRFPIFLCYSQHDEAFAAEVSDKLNRAPIRLKCFFAPDSLRVGDIWAKKVLRAIRGCRVFVILLTPNTLKSRWCTLEIGAAQAHNKRIVAALRHLPIGELPEELRAVHVVKDVQSAEAVNKLVKDIKALVLP